MLELQQVQLSFGDKTILQQLSFTLQQGEIACLLGHSGCGKTTALRAIAGFEAVNGGQIILNGHIISSAGTHTPAHLRGIGMVFQDYALFPHLNVADNIAFGLGKHNPAQRQARVAELLQLPAYTAPLFGLCIGHPAQQPLYRPRMPLAMTVSENHYRPLNAEALAAYETILADYYQRRSGLDLNWQQAVANNFARPVRPHILPFLQEQGLARR